MDGTPTAVTFEIDRDERRVLHWCGLLAQADGQEQWFDLAARTVEPVLVGGGVPSLASTGLRTEYAL